MRFGNNVMSLQGPSRACSISPRVMRFILLSNSSSNLNWSPVSIPLRILQESSKNPPRIPGHPSVFGQSNQIKKGEMKYIKKPIITNASQDGRKKKKEERRKKKKEERTEKMKKKPHPHAEKSSSVTLGAILGRIGGKESCRSRLLDGVGPRRDPAFHPTRPPSNRHRRLASPFRVKLLPPAAVGAGPGNGHPSSLRQASFRESWPNFTRSPSPISAHFPASTRFIGIHRDSSGFIGIHRDSSD